MAAPRAGRARDLPANAGSWPESSPYSPLSRSSFQLRPDGGFEIVGYPQDLAAIPSLDEDPQERLGAGIAEEHPAAVVELRAGALDGSHDRGDLLDRDPPRHTNVTQNLRHLLERRKAGERLPGFHCDRRD